MKATKPAASSFLALSPDRKWRPIPNFPDYDVSNDGRVRRSKNGHFRMQGEFLRGFFDPRGYVNYGLTSAAGSRHNIRAHVLVARTFLEPSPAGKPFALHKDDKKLNCISSNLKWGSHADNMDDAKINLRFNYGADHHNARKPWNLQRGERRPQSKLQEHEAAAIFSDARSQDKIAESYGIAQSTVSRIKRGIAWQHVTDPKYRSFLESGGAECPKK